MARFSYYASLGTQDRATYRLSDAIEKVPLPRPRAGRALLRRIEGHLEQGRRLELEKAVRDLVRNLCEQLEVPKVRMIVRSVRPSDDYGELHGLYTSAEGRSWAVIEIWMRTAKHKRPVAFRTFVRTVLHELCHHLDFELHGLEESFHTEGFFKRESHLLRQLLA